MISEDQAAYLSYPTHSVAGWLGLATTLGPNLTEETSFFGLPLLVLVTFGWVLLRRSAAPGRRATLVALAVTAAVLGGL